LIEKEEQKRQKLIKDKDLVVSRLELLFHQLRLNHAFTLCLLLKFAL